MKISQEVRTWIREQLNIRVRWLTENPCFLWAKEKNRVRAPRGVMVHSTGANNPRLSRYIAPDDGEMGPPSSRHWNQENGNKGVHAFVGQLADGTAAVRQTLPWDYEGWHCAGKANRTHIGFECCEDAIDPDKLECWQYFRDVYRQAALLTAHLCARYHLDPGAPGVVICHCEGHKLGVASNHADVLHWWPRFGRNMDDFRRDVRTLMEGRQIPDVEIPARLLPQREPENEEKNEEKEEIEMNKEELFACLDEYFDRRGDRPASDWAASSQEEAKAWGITDGSRPCAFAERQEVAAMVVRGVKRQADKLPQLIREELARQKAAAGEQARGDAAEEAGESGEH